MHGERENQELDIEGNIAAPPGRSISSDKELLAAISDFYARNPNVIGGGDILTVTGGKPVARAGMVAAILAGLAIEGGERAMLRIIIVIPPGDDVAEADGRAWESFGKSFEMLACRPLEADEAAWFRDYLVVQAATDGRHVSLLALMAEQLERTAIIVVEAAEYRDDAIAPFVADGAQTPLIPEDVWAPQVHALAVAAAPIARERHLYVALDVNEGSPIRPALGDLILSVDGFGVMGSTADESAETILAKRVDAWDRWIALGQAGRALADVDALPPVTDPQKPFLRVQLLHKAGLRLEALALIRSEFLARDQLDPSTRVRLGRIAEDAGAAQLAAELIAPCIDALESREDLESALGTLEHRDEVLAVRIATRLEARFPNAEGVRRHRRQQLLRARDHAGVAHLLRESDAARADFHARLAEAFADTAVPDYVGLIQSGDTSEISDGYRLASIVDALARGLIWHAFNLVGDIPKGPAQAERWEGLALEVLERGFLQAGPDGEPAAGIEATEALLGKLIERLAGDPMNARLRSGIVDLLKPEVAGSTGLALIAKHVLDLAGRPVAVDKGAKEGSANMEWMMAHKPFLHRALNWLQAEQPIIIGKLALPAELLTESPDEAISALLSYIERAPISDDSDIHSVQLHLALAAAMAPHAVDPDIDLRLYRLAAGKIASSGFAQTGRDLVEVAVQAGTATPRRRRLAWFAVADTYHRTRDHLTGLVALACAFAADDRADEEELWQEVYGLTRLLRDIGLLDAGLNERSPRLRSPMHPQRVFGLFQRHDDHAAKYLDGSMQRREAMLLAGGALMSAAVRAIPAGAAIATAQDVPEPGLFLARAEAIKPVLRETIQSPLRSISPRADPALPLGWRIETHLGVPELEATVLNRGDSLIIDFGGHRTGYLSFDLIGMGSNVDAPARLQLVFGEVISDVAEPLHPYSGTLSEAWLPEEVVTIDFLPQRVELPRRYAFRFVKVEVIATSSSFGVSLRNIRTRAVTSAPASYRALPANVPADLARIDAVATATLRDCMQTVFEDGPRRDQRLWTGDLRLQALTSYAAMPNHDLVKRCLYLLAAFPREDGLLPGDVFERPVPARANDYPYDYAVLFAVTLADYVEASGDTATGAELWPTAFRQLEILYRLVNADGNFIIPNGVWVFIDWHDRLDRAAAMHAIYLYGLKRALMLAKRLGRGVDVAGYPERIARLAQAALDHHYDRAAKLFVSGRTRQVSMASQAWMAIAGVGGRRLGATALRTAFADKNAIRPRTPYLNHYVAEALFETGCASEAVALIREYWGGMVEAGADTFWEAYSTENPRVAPYRDFHINSFCHAWSCTPAYLLRKYASQIG